LPSVSGPKLAFVIHRHFSLKRRKSRTQN
jgi:hypothetical protein